MRLPLSGIDWFHHLVHRMVTDHGGGGNLGQACVRLSRPADAAALARAWSRVGHDAWTAGARLRTGLRGPAWIVRGPARLQLERGGSVRSVADAHLREGLPEDGPRLRLASAEQADDAGLVLTWDHRLCDARGVFALLAALPGLADGGRLRDRWWQPRHRQGVALPATAAERGRLARGSIETLKPHRLARLWRPRAEPGNAASPLARVSLVLGTEETAAADRRQATLTGRFGETAWLLACLAAALEDVGGIGGDLLFPFAVDARPRSGGPILANCHSFIFLRVPEGLASRDLAAAAKHLKDAHKAWVGADMTLKMSSAMSFFQLFGERVARMQISNFRAGVAASCCVANAGVTTLPESLFGARVLGIDHAATVPGMPGIGALFHRDARGLGCDLMAAGAVARSVPPERVAERLRWHLVERPLGAA